jgi:hypothetical protein
MTAVFTTISIIIVACTTPTTPPPSGAGPQFLINSPLDGGFTAGTFFFSVQPFDPSDVQKVDFEVDGVAVGSDSTAGDGFRLAVSASDHAAGEVVLRATVVGKNGRSSTGTVTVENMPNPPSSTTVGTDGAVLGTARGSTLGIRPGDAVGANVSFSEQTQAEVKAASGVDYAALGVTFLGAQEIDSDVTIVDPLMVSSADFASFVQAGQAIVNYQIVSDLDGDGVGELVVVNSASVAGDDVISDPMPALQLGDAIVTGQSGSARFAPQQAGITGRPGDLVEIEATGLNPVLSRSNLVVWTSLVDSTVIETYATATGSEPQTITFGIPPLPAGPATVELSNLSAGSALEPFDATILTVSSLVSQQAGSAEEIIDLFLVESLAFVQGLPTDGVGSAEAKADLISQLTSLKQDFAIVFDDLAASPDPDLEAALDQIATLFRSSPLLSLSASAFSTQDLTASEKSVLNWTKFGTGVAGFFIGGYFTVSGVACVAAVVVCGVGLGLAATALLIEGYMLAEDERPGCPSAVSSGGLAEALGLTGMGSATPSGGSGCGGASGGSGSGASIRSQQADIDPILIKIFVGSGPLPFTGVADVAGYFYIPIIPEGEPFTAVATDTGSNEVRTVEGIGPALGESVYLYFDFSSDRGALPTFPLDSNISGPIGPSESQLFTFVGTVGQLISIGAQGDPAFTGLFSVELLDPSSNTLIDRGASKFYSESVVVALPQSGPNILSVNSSTGSGTYNVGLSEIAAPTPLDIGTSPKTVSDEQTVYGDRHFFSFTAQAGDLHKFSLTLPAGSEFNASIDVRGPNPDPFYQGPELLTPTVSVTSSTSTGGLSVSDPFLVPATGTYVIELERGNSSDPIEVALGAWEFSVLTPDPATAIVIGDTVMDDIGLPGEIDLFTFTATASQKVDFSTDNVAAEVDQVNWSVTAPDGSEIFDEPLFKDPGTFTLAEGGTYTIMVGSDSDAGSGAYEFTLVNVP